MFTIVIIDDCGKEYKHYLNEHEAVNSAKRYDRVFRDIVVFVEDAMGKIVWRGKR